MNASSRVLYSIIAPLYNEEEILPEFYRRMKAICDSFDGDYELIFVNDGSNDRSSEILLKIRSQNQKIKIINFSRNFGHQMAITAGIDHASGDAVIIIDADLQDPPEIIPLLIGKWKKGYEIVYGQRVAREGETVFKKGTAAIFYKILKIMTSYPIPENVSDFRLMDKKVVTVLRKVREQHRFMRGLVSWVGFKQGGVAFVRDPRYAGETKYPFRKMLKFALDGITSFSIVPLRMTIYLGFFIVVTTVIFAIWAFIMQFVFHATIQGWASLMIAILFLGGIQLLMSGVLGEYIGRIYEEVKKRPLYIIENKEGF